MEALRSTLKDMGWKASEVSAYVCLLDAKALTPADLATRSGVPESRIHSVLKNLAGRGAVRQTAGHGSAWVALSPKLLVQGHLQAVEEQTQEAVSQGMAAFDRAQDERRQLEPKAWARYGDKDIADEFRRLVEGASVRIKVMCGTGTLTEKLRKRLQAACERGVAVDVLATAADERRLMDLAAAGATCRKVEVIPWSMLVADGREAAAAFSGPETVISLKEPDFADMLEGRHGAAWASGVDVTVVRLAP